MWKDKVPVYYLDETKNTFFCLFFIRQKFQRIQQYFNISPFLKFLLCVNSKVEQWAEPKRKHTCFS